MRGGDSEREGHSRRDQPSSSVCPLDWRRDQTIRWPSIAACFTWARAAVHRIERRRSGTVGSAKARVSQTWLGGPSSRVRRGGREQGQQQDAPCLAAAASGSRLRGSGTTYRRSSSGRPCFPVRKCHCSRARRLGRRRACEPSYEGRWRRAIPSFRRLEVAPRPRWREAAGSGWAESWLRRCHSVRWRAVRPVRLVRASPFWAASLALPPGRRQGGAKRRVAAQILSNFEQIVASFPSEPAAPDRRVTRPHFQSRSFPFFHVPRRVRAES